MISVINPLTSNILNFCLTATNNDFSYVSSTISLSSGVTVGETHCVTINVIDDTRVENNEYFTLRIQNRYNTRTEGSTSLRINIRDNDGKIKSIHNV